MLQRMLDLTENPFIVGDATKLVIAQRLIRCLCPKCSVERAPSENLIRTARDILRISSLEWDSLPKHFREPVGCAACALTGFRGRTMVGEVLEVSSDIQAALMRRAPVSELRAIAVREGMSTLAAEGIRKAAEGRTSLGEVMHFLAPIYHGELNRG